MATHGMVQSRLSEHLAASRRIVLDAVIARRLDDSNRGSKRQAAISTVAGEGAEEGGNTPWKARCKKGRWRVKTLWFDEMRNVFRTHSTQGGIFSVGPSSCSHAGQLEMMPERRSSTSRRKRYEGFALRSMCSKISCRGRRVSRERGDG